MDTEATTSKSWPHLHGPWTPHPSTRRSTGSATPPRNEIPLLPRGDWLRTPTGHYLKRFNSSDDRREGCSDEARWLPARAQSPVSGPRTSWCSRTSVLVWFCTSLFDEPPSAGGPSDPRLGFCVTIDELPDYLTRPAEFGEVIAGRAAKEDYLNQRVPPPWFDGQIPEPSTWPFRGEAAIERPCPVPLFRVLR